MRFETLGDAKKPAVLFFHAMGVTGESSEPVARYLEDRYFCILPTSTVYCPNQHYESKAAEVRQVEDFLRETGIERLAMTPFLYLAIKSVFWTKGASLKKILWCGDASIRPFFLAAGKALRYGDIRRQMMDSLEDKPFPALSEALQARTFFSFGSAEEHFKYREVVKQAYPMAHFPVFEGYNHMQYQIKDPAGFAGMLSALMETGRLPDGRSCFRTAG